MTSRGTPTVLVLAVVILASGCGEKKLSAEEFVDAVQDEGFQIWLGERLVTEVPDKELYAVELEPLPGPEPSVGGEHDHGGGSLAVYDEVGQAEDELHNCEDAQLACYRAANVVVILEEQNPRLAVAISKLAQN
jgi:hypothetical protein